MATFYGSEDITTLQAEIIKVLHKSENKHTNEEILNVTTSYQHCCKQSLNTY